MAARMIREGWPATPIAAGEPCYPKPGHMLPPPGSPFLNSVRNLCNICTGQRHLGWHTMEASYPALTPNRRSFPSNLYCNCPQFALVVEALPAGGLPKPKPRHTTASATTDYSLPLMAMLIPKAGQSAMVPSTGPQMANEPHQEPTPVSPTPLNMNTVPKGPPASKADLRGAPANVCRIDLWKGGSPPTFSNEALRGPVVQTMVQGITAQGIALPPPPPARNDAMSGQSTLPSISPSLAHTFGPPIPYTKARSAPTFYHPNFSGRGPTYPEQPKAVGGPTAPPSLMLSTPKGPPATPHQHVSQEMFAWLEQQPRYRQNDSRRVP